MLELRIVSPVFKVFHEEDPVACEPRFSGLKNEVISFQLAYRSVEPTTDLRCFLRLEIDSPAKEFLRVRRVKTVPVRMASFENTDDYYLHSKLPGLYPDILEDVNDYSLRTITGLWEALWFDLEPAGALPAGDYPITLRLSDMNTGEVYGEASVSVHLIDAELPKQTLIHTKWLHTDCLADWYNVPVFSEEYWRITENNVRLMVRRGINTVLTPIHTPPLDTRVGSYRPTVQLVDVKRTDGGYTFGFDKLRRWVEMCVRCGVEYYEMAHLFSQWGASCAPQVVAETENGTERIFGWDTPATGEAYAAFLRAYLPALRKELDALGISDRCFFHISDEPNEAHLADYTAARALVADLLDGCVIMDALSNPAFYDNGVIDHPIPGCNHIEPFLERKVPGLWTYYCCGQGTDVTNLFIAMPGARTRILGTQLYKFEIAGFLQWGFNFYYSQYSNYKINPWLDTDGDGFSPAGDCFQVYPGRDGQPVESIRMMLVEQALQDQRAMQLLESLSDRETVVKLIDEGVEPIRFDRFPHNDEYILSLREKINREIEKRL